jgi:hypothetical protein
MVKRRKVEARDGEAEAPSPIPIDPARYTAPVVLNMAEVQLLQQVLATVPMQGTADVLEGLLPVVRSIRGKLTLASQVIQRKLPKAGRSRTKAAKAGQ